MFFSDVLDWVKGVTGSQDGCPRDTTNPPPPSGCMTVDGEDPNQQCVFPFNFDGVTYDGCIFVGTAYPGETRPWCSTQTDGNGDHVMGQGKWGYCSAEVSQFISWHAILPGFDHAGLAQILTFSARLSANRLQPARIPIAPPSARLLINAAKEAARSSARSTVTITSTAATLATE